jgi:hypothetical protein
MGLYMKKKNKVKENVIKYYQKSIGYYVPLFIIIVVPLIVRGVMIELPIEAANFWKGGTKHIDLFSYYKSLVLVMGTIAAICTFLSLYLNKKLDIIKEKKYYIPMLIYAIFAIISTILSKNKYVSVNGFMEINQGIFVLLSYILITFIMMNYVKEDRDIKVFVYLIMTVTIMEGLLGLTQYFGYDIFQSSFGRWLIMPSNLRNTELNFNFGSYTIYGTLYNTNYVGSFAALVLPISFILYLYSTKNKTNLINGIVSLLAFTLWIGCNSRAGYLGVLFSSLIGAVIFRKKIKSNYKKVLLLSFLYCTVIVILNSVSSGKVASQFTRLSLTNEVEKMNTEKLNVRFEEISIENNKLIIKTSTEKLIGYVNESKINFMDETGKDLSVISNNDEFRFTDERFKEYSFIIKPDKPYILKANIYGRKLNLFVQDEEIKIVSINNKLTLPIEAPRFNFFDGRERFASNRGYIWSRSVPMLKDTLIVGYGPDNFVLQFPQEDYVGKFNTGGNMTQTIVDKPHNMYMQMAINTGAISLIALIVLWGIYIIDCVKLYFTSELSSFVEYIGAALFLSIVGYLVAGLFNDSIISVAPLFWVLLGMGIGINEMIRIRTNNNQQL